MAIVPDPQDSKQCSKCLLVKPLTDYYIDKRYPRYFSWCKVCHCALTMANYVPAVKRERQRPAQKICARCGCEFATNGKRYSRCAPCRRADQAVYRDSHREQLRAAGRAYYAADPAACVARALASIAKKPEHYQRNNQAWKAANKDAVNASTNKRRARIKGNGGQWTAAEWQAIKVAQDFRCLMCGRREPDIKLCFDHIVPVSLGGPNTAVNGQGLCRSCNSKKHRRVLDLRKDT
jgi:5-methylcytosine-specific restriction endonuclease McrA